MTHLWASSKWFSKSLEMLWSHFAGAWKVLFQGTFSILLIRLYWRWVLSTAGDSDGSNESGEVVKLLEPPEKNVIKWSHNYLNGCGTSERESMFQHSIKTFTPAPLVCSPQHSEAKVRWGIRCKSARCGEGISQMASPDVSSPTCITPDWKRRQVN